MKVFEYKCDLCGRKAPAKYNGEHWLVPVGWVQLWDDNLARTIDEHICSNCKPKPKKAKRTQMAHKGDEK